MARNVFKNSIHFNTLCQLLKKKRLANSEDDDDDDDDDARIPEVSGAE